MSAKDERIRDLITEQAAEWFVVNRSGLSDRERAEFSVWLRTSPIHVQEYLAISSVARDLRAACMEAGSIDAIVTDARAAEREAPDVESLPNSGRRT